MATLPSPEDLRTHPRLSDDARALGEGPLADVADEAARLLGLLGPSHPGGMSLAAFPDEHNTVLARALAHQVNHLVAREPTMDLLKSESIGGVASQTMRDDLPLIAPLAAAALHGVGWLLPGDLAPTAPARAPLPILRSLR